MDVFRLLGIIFLFASPTLSQDCPPCSCCKVGTGCAYNTQLRIDNYCWGGCNDGYMSPQCQKPCVHERCQTCSAETVCDACYDGYYGNQCQSKCPSTCTMCSSSTVCTSCINGFHRGSGTTCVNVCKTECLACTNATSCTACGVKGGIGFYGSDCSMICSYKCKYHLCDINGICAQCPDPNFIGDNCDRCIDGKYGSQCKNNCPDSCLSCESASYCTSCIDGFKGITCSTKTECPDNCSNDAVCLSSGICESCKDRFYGEYCNMTCSQNCRYGDCNQDGYCKAGCEDGFNGSRCEQRICQPNCNCNYDHDCIGCNSNHFGPSCSFPCSSCKENTCPVDSLNARKCDECAGGTYGNICKERCPENCLNDNCDQEGGSCTCENEYKFQDGACVHSLCPANCSTCNSSNNCNSCVDEYYHGDTCVYKCSNCRSGTTCRKSDGYCQDECAEGFSGDTCDTPCNGGCATCTRSQTNECLSCKTGRHGYDGSYYTCRNNCNNACANNSCDALNGQCDQGCEYGYSGSFCNSSCPANCKSCHQYNGRGCIEEIVADNNGAVMIGAMGGVIALLSVSLALSVGYIVFMKRRHNREHTEKQSASDSKADEEARTYEQ